MAESTLQAPGHGHGCGCAGCSPAVEPAAREPVADAVPSTAVLSAGGVLALQRSIGNAAVGAVLARRGFFGGAETEQERYEDALEDKKEFIADGKKGPDDFQSSTGIGGFEVAYDPASWEMAVKLRGSVNFVDGIWMMGNFAIPVQPKPATQAAARAINLMPAAARAAAAAGWQWDGTAKAAFLARFEAVVMKIWTGQHMFHCSRRYWEDMGAIPSVEAHVHEGEKSDDDHMAMSVYRVPPNFVGTVGVVHSGGGLWGAPTNNTMTLNSNDVEQRADDVLNVSTSFTAGATTVDPSATAGLKQFAIRFQSGGPLCGICGSKIEAVGGVAIIATVDGEGADPNQNAHDRFDNLVAALVAGGMSDAATRLQFAMGSANGTSAQLRVGSGVPQIVAAHEAGHMFGLGDRYATTAGSGIGGTGPSVGLPSKHDQLAKKEGLENAKAANDDGIMSFGNEVRPADYATFMEALKDVSGISQWAFGPTTAVVPPGTTPPPAAGPPTGPGDFPTPTGKPDTVMA